MYGSTPPGADEHNTFPKSTIRHVKLDKFIFGTPWLPNLLCKQLICIISMEFLLLSRRRSSVRNVPSGEERGETDIFAGYQISKTEHPNLENEAPKTRKRSTLTLKAKHPKLETCLSGDSPLSSHQQQESSAITSRMQFKTIQVELRGVANAFPSPWLLAISELRKTLGRVSDLNYR